MIFAMHAMQEPFDLYSPEIDADPFPYYDMLREQHPCYWSESGQLWILSRYEDIVAAARDWETFSSAQGTQIADRLHSIPGVESVTASFPFPLAGDFSTIRWGKEEALADATKYQAVDWQIVRPGYFDTPRRNRNRTERWTVLWHRWASRSQGDRSVKQGTRYRRYPGSR